MNTMQPQTVMLPSGSSITFNPYGSEQGAMEAIRQKAALKRAALFDDDYNMLPCQAAAVRPIPFPACPPPVDPCEIAKVACSAAKPKSCFWPWVFLLILAGVLAVVAYQAFKKRWGFDVDTHGGKLSAKIKDKKRMRDMAVAEAPWPSDGSRSFSSGAVSSPNRASWYGGPDASVRISRRSIKKPNFCPH